MEYPTQAYGSMVMYEGEVAVQQLNAKRFNADKPLTSGTHSVVVDVMVNGSWARWIDTTLTITKPTATFNKAGGTGGSSSTKVDYNVANPTISVPTRDGYTFQGYYTGENGTGSKYWNADGTSASKWLLTGSQTIYAYWTPNDYPITYLDQGGEEFSGTHETGYPTTHTYGTATTLKGATKDGSTFLGWYDNSSCSGTAVTSIDSSIMSNTTLYAKWISSSIDVNALGGYRKSGNDKVQMVMFGFTFMAYNELDDSDSFGAYIYSSSSSLTPTKTFVSTSIEELKNKEGRFYCTYDCEVDGATYYAKAYVITGGKCIYSSLCSATGNYEKEYSK